MPPGVISVFIKKYPQISEHGQDRAQSCDIKPALKTVKVRRERADDIRTQAATFRCEPDKF